MSDSIFDKIRFLVRYLNECTKAYDEGHPTITDEEWDNKYFELKNLEEETGLILSNSPTQNISYDVKNELAKVTHNHKMLSLDKTKSIEDVSSFIGNKPYIAMCKMDGLTCTLTYKDGELVSAETRGNGFIGEDILHNVKTLPSVPTTIPVFGELIIDGEIICTYTDFQQYETQYKNPRNFAAGSIRLLDSKECAKRNLTFVVWDVISEKYFDDGIEYRLDQKLNFLRPFGFTIVPYIGVLNGALCSKNEYGNVIEKIQALAKENGFPIDGVVFKFADCAYGRSLGETAHHFKNALAYKFYDETYSTELLNIEWTMGRTGILTPVAIFEPVDIDGSTVNRASLHNISVMHEILGLYPYKHQAIEIYKANMIIPQIASAKKIIVDANGSVIKVEDPRVPIDNTNDYFAKIHHLEFCPCCGETLVVKASDNSILNLVCLNSNCEGKLINRLDHFCGKKGLDMKGISKATLEKLINWGWLSNNSDIFELVQYKDEWIKKPGFGVKSVEKILNAIDAGSHCELHQFIAALGIPLIGTTASKELAKKFNNWEEFVMAAENNYPFYEIPNFGPEMHSSIISFDYSEARFIAEHFIHFNAIAKADVSSAEDNRLEGKTFVITGKLSHFKNRESIKEKIEALGGKVTGSVTKNTDYLINNDIESNSSKNKTAKSLEIPILSEEDFIQAFGIQ